MGNFGIYVHIPYCLQICTYCDFVKFELKDLPPTEAYVRSLDREISTRAPFVRSLLGQTPLSSIYFGGGTPSLLAPSEIVAILESIEKAFDRMTKSSSMELTLEINPGTIDERSLNDLLAAGINRFSVGAQTFDERHLKVTGRKHSVQETRDTLELLKSHAVNFSFDLLFGLPGQTLEDVRRDVKMAIAYGPSHLSAYCLTVPEKHPLNRGRAGDEEQAAMFVVIEEELAAAGIFRYEISNFAKPGFESRHNLLYWSDQPYWGVGIGSHSYLPIGKWGTRFWNPPKIQRWETELAQPLAYGSENFTAAFDASRVETLELHQSLTDFLHTALRAKKGLKIQDLTAKYPTQAVKEAERRLAQLEKDRLLVKTGPQWTFAKGAEALADRVFEPLTFLRDDLESLGP